MSKFNAKNSKKKTNSFSPDVSIDEDDCFGFNTSTHEDDDAIFKIPDCPPPFISKTPRLKETSQQAQAVKEDLPSAKVETFQQSPYFNNGNGGQFTEEDVKTQDDQSALILSKNNASLLEKPSLSFPRKLREFGSYDTQTLESEFEAMIEQLNEKRMSDTEAFHQFSQTLRVKTEEIISNMEKSFKRRYDLIDAKLHKAGNEFFAKVEQGHKLEADLNDIKTRISNILQDLPCLVTQVAKKPRTG